MFCTHHLLPHHVSHTALSHTIFHIQLCHTLSFTHNFHTHHLSHTTLSPRFSLSHTIFHIPLCLTQLFTYNLFYFSIIHHILCLSFLPRPPTTFVDHYWKKLNCRVIRSFNFCFPIQNPPWSYGWPSCLPSNLKGSV